MTPFVSATARLLLVLLVVLGLPAVNAMTAPASAEPHFTIYRCSTTGGTATIKRITECASGTVSVWDSYDADKVLYFDGQCAKLEAIDGATRRQIYSRCAHRNEGITLRQALIIVGVAIKCYATKKPSCLLPLLKL